MLNAWGELGLNGELIRLIMVLHTNHPFLPKSVFTHKLKQAGCRIHDTGYKMNHASCIVFIRVDSCSFVAN